MATFRSSIVALALLGVACTAHENSEPPVAAAAITRQQIEHITPKRDFVGAAPARFEWTAVDGVDSYTITVMSEIDRLVFQHVGAHGTTIDWPKEMTLEAGTYFWRVVGLKGDRSVADSGRSAFVVTTP